jgi:type VI secretion system protein ImpL
VTPKPDPAQPWLSVDEKSISYRFTDSWALYSFIVRHRDMEPAGSRGDARSQLLRFEFPIAKAADVPNIRPTESQARVFLRLTVSPPGKRVALPWPGPFPIKAPGWSSP